MKNNTGRLLWISRIIWSLFWLLSFIILHGLFTIDFNNGWIDILFTLLFHIPLIILFSIHLWIIRITFLSKKYIWYAVTIIMMNLAGIYLFNLVFGPFSKFIFPNYYFSLYYTNYEIIQFISAYLIITLLISLSLNWYSLKNKQIILQKEHHKVKMDNLKGQLNPHFLFNSLNNIYALAKENKKVTSNYILQLSESLRYMIYDTDEPFVLLENEIQYLKNYIELEKLRMEDTSHIQFTIVGDYSGYVIAPLILLPVVENCFKHCNRNQPAINIHIMIKDEELVMQTNNNIKRESIVMKYSGVGMENFTKRLNMIYSEKYEWNQYKKDYNYSTTLKIKLGDHD